MKLINVRAEILYSKRRRLVLVTDRISNPVALIALLQRFEGVKRQRIVIHDDEAFAAVADQVLAQARKEQSHVELVWGRSGEYSVDMAGMPALLPVATQDEPRDFAGPLPDEVAAHTIAPPATLKRLASDVSMSLSADELLPLYDTEEDWPGLPTWLVRFVEWSGRGFGWLVGNLYVLIMAPPQLRVVREEE